MRYSLGFRLSIYALIALALSVILVAATEPSARRVTELPPMPWSSVVLISDGTGFCSGFVIGKGLIATAGHCATNLLGDKRAQFIKFIDGAVVPYKLLSSREKDDCLAEEWTLLVADTGRHRPFRFSPILPSPGDPVWHVGHPDAVPQEVLVVGRIGYTLPTALILEGTAIPGESGSPVVNRDGDVVGIVNCGSNVQDKTIASKLTSLRAFMATFGLN